MHNIFQYKENSQVPVYSHTYPRKAGHPLLHTLYLTEAVVQFDYLSIKSLSNMAGVRA